MLKLIKRASPNWYIRGTVRGQSVDESTGTSNKKVAEEIRAKREAELLLESVHGKQATYTFSQAALSYLELGGDKRFMQPLLLHFGTTKLSAIDQPAIDRAALKLYPGRKPATINRQCHAIVSAVMQHAFKRGWVKQLKIDRPKIDNSVIRWITKSEADRLLAACSKELRPLVLFLLYTGARCGEALWLTWKDVDLERRHVQFTDTKNGTSRGVPLHPLVCTELRKLHANSNGQDSCVFRTARGVEYHRPTGDDLSDTSAGSRIKTAFRGATRRAELLDFRPHDCRHTWATWHYSANRDLGALQRLGGWKTLSMVMRYAHVNVAELEGSIDRM